MQRRIPLIYFCCLLPGRYLAAWPVFVVGDEPERLRFTIQLDDARVLDMLSFRDIAVKDGFDFIELDGMQGSTGAGSARGDRLRRGYRRFPPSSKQSTRSRRSGAARTSSSC